MARGSPETISRSISSPIFWRLAVGGTIPSRIDSKRDDGFHRTRRPDHVTGDALGGRDRGSVVAEHLVQSLGLGRVVERCGRAVRVHVPDVGCFDTCVLECELHAHGRAGTAGRRRSDVISVAVPPVAGDDPVDLGATRDRTFERFEDDEARAFRHHETVAVGVERTRCASGIVVAGAQRPHAGERGDRERRDTGLGSAGDDRVGGAVTDQTCALADQRACPPRTPWRCTCWARSSRS